MILSLEELENIKVLDIPIYIVDEEAQIIEIRSFKLRITDNNKLGITTRDKWGIIREYIDYFGITSQGMKNLKYPDECRLFSTETQAKHYTQLGLHRKSKLYKSLLGEDNP